MSDGLSQEEINALLASSMPKEEEPKKAKRGRKKKTSSKKEEGKKEVKIEGKEEVKEEIKKTSIIDLTDIEKDILGEVGNISMGSASTALSDMIGKRVTITTPVISITTLKEMREGFEIPNIALEIKYVAGIVGKNILIMKVSDAAIIANIMMGGTGEITSQTLSEIEESAVSEAMNQMMGSAATSMATMFSRKVDISPPKSKIWDSMTSNMSEDIEEDEEIVQVAFRLKVENLIDSVIMQVLSMETVKKIVSIMMGTETTEEVASDVKTNSESKTESDPKQDDFIMESKQDAVEKIKEQAISSKDGSSSLGTINENSTVEVKENSIQNESSDLKPKKIEYKQFDNTSIENASNISKNTSSLFDIPLNIQVVLGDAQRSIKEIMNFSRGTLLELNQVANQPVELHVNGKVIAYGEVVEVNGNLGINILDVNNDNM